MVQRGFEDMNKRFDDLQEEMNDRFNEIERRLDHKENKKVLRSLH